MADTHNSQHTPEGAPITPRKRRVLRWAVGIVLLALLFGIWFVNSAAFNGWVRGKVVEALNQASGGHASVRELHWNLRPLEIELLGVTVRGKESAGQAPLLHVERVFLRLKVFSWLKSDFGIRQLEADHPTVHLVTYSDGTTNIPAPTQKSTQALAQLFHLAVERAVFHDGVIFWNGAQAPLAFAGNDMTLQMGYSVADQAYEGKFSLGKLDVKLKDVRPVAANAEINFKLYPTRLDVSSFRLTSGHSQLEASGQVEDFNSPHGALQYSATFDVREAGAILRDARLRGGEVGVAGKGTFAPGEIKSEGRVTLHHGEIEAANLRVPGIDAGANFVLTGQHIEVSSLFAHALGGSVTGRASVENWASGLPIGAALGATSLPQHGTAALHVAGIALAQVAAMASSRDVQLNRVKSTGTMGGTVTAQWTGSPANAVADLALDVVPPAQPAPDQVPVTARLRARYNVARDLLDLAELDLATRATRLNASGTVGSRTSQLKVALTTSSLGEIAPAIAAFGGPDPLPMELAGTASFSGTVAGVLTAPTIAGHLTATNFTSIFGIPQPATVAAHVRGTPPRAPPAARPRQVRMHWDELAADVAYAPAQVNLRNVRLRRGNTSIRGNAQAGLFRGRLADTSPVSARAEMRNGDLGELLQIAGTHLPISGKANLEGTASGTWSDARAAGHIEATGAKLWREPVRSLSADFSLANQVVALNNMTVVSDAGQMTGTASYNLQSQAVRYDLHAAGLDVARLETLRNPRATLAGSASFSVQGSGTAESPSVNGNVRITDVVVNGEPMGTVALDAVTQGTEMRLTGSTRLQSAVLLLNGTVQMRGDSGFPASLHLHFGDFDFDPLLRQYLQGRVTGHSIIAGDVRVEGPLGRPRDLNVQGDIGQLSAEIEGVKLRNDGPITFTVAQQVLRLEHLRIAGDDTELTASGTAALSGAQAMDMRADGHINLQVLQSVNPAYQSSGVVTLALHATGSLTRPQFNGRVQIAKGAISYIDLPNGLSEINGTLAFNQNRLQVEQLTARTGGGEFQLGGTIAYANGIALDLTATARDIRLRYPPGVSAAADASLRLTGTANNALLAGDVTVTKFALNQRFDFSLYLARVHQAPTAPDPRSPLSHLHLDVHIVSTPALQVQTSLAKLSGNVDLRLRGTGTRPAVLGRVDIVEGDIFFNGTKYHLERGDVSFTNPTRIEPILNVEASARVRDYDITLGVHGTLERGLGTTYRSEPPLPSADIIALLAFGRTREETALAPKPTASFTETASNAILGQALNSAVTGRMQRLFGVSRLKIDPQVGSVTSNPTARITIEQQVSNKVTLTYITDVTQSQQQVIQFEYNVNRDVSIIGVRDQYGVVGFNVRFRQRKK